MRLLWGIECRGPDGCHIPIRTITWQGACGCWAFKCLSCGDVDGVRCSGDEEHWAEFDEIAEAMT